MKTYTTPFKRAADDAFGRTIGVPSRLALHSAPHHVGGVFSLLETQVEKRGAGLH